MIRDGLKISMFTIAILSVLGIITCLPSLQESYVFVAVIVLQVAILIVALSSFVDLFSADKLQK